MDLIKKYLKTSLAAVAAIGVILGDFTQIITKILDAISG